MEFMNKRVGTLVPLKEENNSKSWTKVQTPNIEENLTEV